MNIETAMSMNDRRTRDRRSVVSRYERMVDKVTAGADEIADVAEDVYGKHIGKTKALDAIESDIRKTLSTAYESTGTELGTTARSRFDSYIAQRMKYVKNSFKLLDNPKTDKSDERAQFIGLTETRDAQAFGTTLGWAHSGKSVQKQWETNGDCCDACSDNEDDGPIDVDELFSSGDYAPGAHPGCDCDIEYVTDDDEMSAAISALQDGWVGFDFDGTLATKLDPYDPSKTGKPIRKMLTKLEHYLDKGVDVRIFTARAGDHVAETAVRRFCMKHFGVELPITNKKDSKMRKLYDDLAINPRDVQAGGPGSGRHKLDSFGNSIDTEEVFKHPVQQHGQDDERVVARSSKTLSLDSIVPTQNFVGKSVVRDYLEGKNPQNPASYKLPIVLQHKGKNFLIDGHHRIVAEILKGTKSYKFNIVVAPKKDVAA